MTMEEENFRETSLDVAPLISDAKATQAWRRFLGTVLGGARIAPGMPLRLYLLQLVIWGFPVILCSGTLLLVPAEPLYWRPVVAGAANGVFTLSVEALRIWLHRRPSEPGAPKAAWFADDDGLDFQCLSPTVVEFLLPRKRPFLLCLLLALSAFLGAAAAAALGPKRLEQQGLDPASAVVVSAWVQLCVATAAFGLHGEAPVELSGRGGEVWPRVSRPILVTALLLPVGAGVGAASMRLLVVVSLLPLGWALGVVPPIDSLIIWSLDQVEVHFFGGTAATDVRRLALALVASAAAAAALGAATPGLHAVDMDPDWRAAVVGGLCLALAACLAPLPPRARDIPKALCRATSALLQAVVAGSAASIVLGVGRLPEELLGFLRLGIEQVCVVLILFAVYAVSAWHFSARVCGFRRPGYTSARAKLLWGETGGPPNSPLPRRNSRVSDILQAEKPLHPDVTSGRSGGADAGAKATTGVTRVYVGLETLVRICLLFHLAVGSSKELVDRGVDGITAEVFFVAALVLRQACIIMSQTPRAAVDIWLAGLLHLASPAYPLYAQVFVVSVLRQRALLLLSHLRYALHLCRVTASVPKLRHPVTWPLLWINVLLFPGLLLVVAIATVLEAPLITIFTLPLFAVGGPRPRHGHIDGSPVEKGLEGLFYSSLEPSLLRGLARRFRVQALPTTPGSAFLCRSHERLLCLVRVLACGFGWVEVELRGLEMQEPTSCHHVEAGLIDDAFAAAFGDLPGRPNDDEAKTRAEPFLFEPVAEVPALGYEQTLVSLRGLLDNPEALRQVHRLFLKSLVFVLSRDLQRRDGKLPEGWLSCPLKSQDMQAAMNLITTASWPPDVAEVLAMPDLRLAADTRQQQQQQPNLEEVYVDSPRSLDNQDSPPLPPGSPPVIRPDTPQRTKGRRQRSERSSTASSLRVRTRTDSADTDADQEEDLDALMDQVLGMDAQTPERPPEVNRSAVGASKNVRKLLSTTSPDGEQQRGLLTTQAAASSSKKEAFRPQTPPSQRTTPAASPKGGMSPGMSGVNSLTLKGLRTFSSEEGTRAQSQASQGPPQLGDLATLVVEAYVAINVAPAFGQIPESLGISHVHRIFSGSIAEGAQVPELLWLQSQPELLYLTLKAFRLALKISIDWVAMGDDLSDLEYSTLAETASELERTWYLGPEGSSKWEGAMRRRVPNLMSMRKKGHSEVQVLRLRLAEDSVRIGQVRSSVLESLWASCAFELRYLANDDDERYSIQAHPTLFRNLAVQSAEYPIYVSRPTTLWL